MTLRQQKRQRRQRNQKILWIVSDMACVAAICITFFVLLWISYGMGLL